MSKRLWLIPVALLIAAGVAYAQYPIMDAVANKVRASSLTITAAGRNLWWATKYDGADPELSYAGRQPGGGTLANFRDASEAFGLPVPRRFSLQVNLGF